MLQKIGVTTCITGSLSRLPWKNENKLPIHKVIYFRHRIEFRFPVDLLSLDHFWRLSKMHIALNESNRVIIESDFADSGF